MAKDFFHRPAFKLSPFTTAFLRTEQRPSGALPKGPKLIPKKKYAKCAKSAKSDIWYLKQCEDRVRSRTEKLDL